MKLAALFFCAGLATVACAAHTPEQVATQTTAEQVRLAARTLPAHPRLHVKGPEGLKAILTSKTPEVVFLRERCAKSSEDLLKAPLVQTTREGKRMKGQTRAKDIIISCAAAYRFSGDRRYAERAKREMLSVCAWPDWSCEHYLDTADILCGLSFGYDWLYDELTVDERALIRQAIITRGYAGMDNGKYCRWRHCRHNWCQVCWQAVVSSALAIWEDDAERSASLIAEGVRAVAGAIEEYGPDGAYPEGPGYWQYGTGRSCRMLHQLDTAFGTTFGLYELGGFARTAEFALAVKGPTGSVFNYSDGGAAPSYIWYSPLMTYFASKAARPEWMRLERTRLGHAMKGAKVNPLHTSASLWTLLWTDFGLRDDPTRQPYPLDYIARGANPIAVLRSSYEPDAFYVGVKAGRVKVNHGNMDVGSFVLEREGVRWAVDLGAESYHKIESGGKVNLWNMEQDSTRWSIFRQGPFSHNLVTIGGRLLKVDAKAEIRVLETGAVTRAVLDLTDVYGRDAVTSAARTFTLDRRADAVVIRDALTGVKAGETIRWAMTTKAESAAIDGNRVTLVNKGKRLCVTMTSASSGQWRFVDISKGPNAWDSENPNTHQLIWEAKPCRNGDVTLEASFLTPRLTAYGPGDRPEAWFHIIGGNASREGISADVKAIAGAGIGGIQFFHGQFGGMWPGVKEPIPCLSEKWDGFVAHLADECRANGITFKMQNCPGWSMSGGPWVPKEKAMRNLVAFEPGKKPNFDAESDYHEIGAVTFPVPRGESEAAFAPDAVETNGDTRVFRFNAPVTVRSIVLSNPQQINHGWCYEPGVRFRLAGDGVVALERDCPQGAWSDGATMTFATKEVSARVWTFTVSHKHNLSRYPAVVLSGRIRLDHWETKAGLALRDFEMLTDTTSVAAEGSKTLVFGYVNAKRRNHPAPPEATGWECDKMDAEGFEANFNGYVGRLLKGPLAGKGLCGLLVDSWECGPTRWTPKMETEFRRLNGYEIRPWLPALFGHIVKSAAETERFLLDWRRTCSRLVEDNYYGAIARLAHENGLMAQYETAFGDVLTGDLMRFWKWADEPMCEFWSPFANEEGFVYSHDFKPVRPCVSAAHIYGKRRVSAEAFTSFKLTFDETLQSRKEDANIHLCRGLTHLVFQTYTHNPVIGGRPPSSSFGSGIGTPFLREQTWWPFMPGFTRYLAVCGHALERGKAVVDILWYVGDALGHKPSEHGDRFGPGYKYDYLNRDALETRLDVRDGRFVLPDGMSYRALWIPKGTYLLPETERLIAALEKKGGRVVRGDFTPDWPEDVSGAPCWYHRRDGDESIYFVANFRTPFQGEVRFRDWPKPVTMNLAPGEARLVSIKDGTIRVVEPETGRADDGAKPCGEQLLAKWSRPLGYWRDLPGSREEKGFSGTRSYSARIVRPFPAGDKRRLVLDLGEVLSCARVVVNGRELARLWCAPYRVDVTEALREGENEVCVEVTSTWRNRLIVDAGLPEAERKTWTIAGPDKGHGFAKSGWAGPAKLVFLAR